MRGVEIVEDMALEEGRPAAEASVVRVGSHMARSEPCGGPGAGRGSSATRRLDRESGWSVSVREGAPTVNPARLLGRAGVHS